MIEKLLLDKRISLSDPEKLTKKLAGFNKDKLQIVIDFDNTVTQENGTTSWSLFQKSWTMPEWYNQERIALFEHYHPFELDHSLSFEMRDMLMREWWSKHLELFIRYKLNINTIDKIVENSHFVEFRKWMDDFLELAYEHNIPLIILSAWITNTITEFLKGRWHLYDNMHIVSNELAFDIDGYCIWMNKETIIHSENKDEHYMPDKVREMVEGKTDIILIWDSLTDVKMIDTDLRDGAIKIGFLAKKKIEAKTLFLEAFDIVIESELESLGVPLEILKSTPGF